MSVEHFRENDQSREAPQWWSIIIALLAIAVFGEAIFAGAMLSGVAWAHTAHAMNARILIAATIIASFGAFVGLRNSPRRKKFGWLLLSFTVMIVLQSALGVFTAKGINLLWVHVPLGVALFSIAVHAAIATKNS